MQQPPQQDGYAWIKPRNLQLGERSYECKSPDPRGMPPMFHLAHPFGPCPTRMADGDECGCTAGVQQSRGDA